MACLKISNCNVALREKLILNGGTILKIKEVML